MKVIKLPYRSTAAAREVRLPADEAARLETLEQTARQLVGAAEPSSEPGLVVEARCDLPTEHGQFDVRLFRHVATPGEHLVISCGDLSAPGPVPVRVHSECFTGEVLHSNRCECRQQLDFALHEIQSLGRGLVVYLRQEGRGIGLANKLRAYALQALGADTVDANRLLGLPDDARTYEAAAAVLRHLGVREVALMTNNPAKATSLESLGIPVTARLPVLVASHPIARRYLETKRDRMAHMVPVALPASGD